MQRTRAFFSQCARYPLLTVFILLLTVGSSRAFGMNYSEPTDTSMTLSQFIDLLFDGDTTDVHMNISIDEFSQEELLQVWDRLGDEGGKEVQKELDLVLDIPTTNLNDVFKRFLRFDSIRFQKEVRIIHLGEFKFVFNNCTFNDLYIHQQQIEFQACAFTGHVTMHCTMIEPEPEWAGAPCYYEFVNIIECSFYKAKVHFGNYPIIRIIESSFHLTDLDGNYPLGWDSEDSFIQSTSSGVSIDSDNDEITDLSILGSHFHVNLSGYDVKVTRHFNIEGSQLKFLDFNGLEPPEDIYEFKCKWDQLDTALGITAWEGGWKHEIPSAKSVRIHEQESALDERTFDLLRMKAYMVANIYRAQGDLKSYNGAYKRIKKLENARYGIEYKENPTFEGLFKWRLNELLFYYSDYGTNPAKAVIKSIWVILIFALFYLLFPSEWDISSKSMILANLKNAKGSNGFNWKAVLKALMAFLVSCANAITLSLNSFITLGFGHIPTKGMARYFTIIQGFIGWFLLTIFSVSLISQILN